MADKSYDAVIIGGGHHGTIIACYLQWAGLETAIFERQHELGGGACGDEQIIPGFISDPCASMVRFYGHPAYSDFKLWEKGINHVIPELSAGIVFDDETSLITYPAFKVADKLTGEVTPAPENVDKAYKEIAKFSERDAETYMVLLAKYRNKWQAAWREHLFTAPPPWEVQDPIERLFDDPVDGIDPAYQFMSTAQRALDLFESVEMRLFFLKTTAANTECRHDDVLSVYSMLHSLGTMMSWSPTSFVMSGSHAVTHALQRAFSEMGGKFFVHHEVDKIIIDNGAAKGIRLADGTEIEARKVVVADVDTNQLIFRLIGEEHVSPKVAERVRNIDYDRGQVMWGHVAMHELPQYKASQHNPDCQEVPRLELMPKDLDYYIFEHDRQVFTRGYADKVTLTICPHTRWDPTRTPEGKHVALFGEAACPARYFTERQWLQIGKDFANEAIRQWQDYAPNMTMDNVIGSVVSTPFEVVTRNINMLEGSTSMGSMAASQWGRLRPTPELSGYRMPVKNVYLCSSSTHPSVAIGRGSGYICYKVIAEDLGLRKIWEEKGRPY